MPSGREGVPGLHAGLRHNLPFDDRGVRVGALADQAVSAIAGLWQDTLGPMNPLGDKKGSMTNG